MKKYKNSYSDMVPWEDLTERAKHYNHKKNSTSGAESHINN